MDILVNPSTIGGTVIAPPSKSYSHRYIISTFLSGGGLIVGASPSKDVLATLNALSALGLKYSFNEKGVDISVGEGLEKGEVDCDESGSTLRFLLPIFSALGKNFKFTGAKSLLSRPMDNLVKTLNANGAEIENLKINGKLRSGTYEIDGDISSQFITGLIMALPLLSGDSKIIIKGKTVSKGYIDITLEVIKEFGIKVKKTSYGYYVYGSQTYKKPKVVKVQGDYSNGAFLLSLGALSKGVTVLNLPKKTSQGDKKIVFALKKFGAKVKRVKDGYFVKRGNLKGALINAQDIPDIVQILSVIASFSKGVTTIKNVERLKIKESDRISGIVNNLSKAGVKVEYKNGSLIIDGGVSNGSEFSGDNDHRTVMSAIVLATFLDGESKILGVEAINKSYPNFILDYKKLGGKIDGDI